MRVLYLAQYNSGSTSKMRGEYLKSILNGSEFKAVNLDIPMSSTPRFLRSIGWRYKFGPLVRNINEYLLQSLKGDFKYDLVWVDKGVFIKPDLIHKLKEKSSILIHYTPDAAFITNRSQLFYKALPFYDFCVTTKSFEIANYQSFGVETLFCTQGYDPKIHRPFHEKDQKRGVIFIGHLEDQRGEIVADLVEAGIEVTVAGSHWEKFCKKYKHKPNLKFKGDGIYSENYGREISAAQIGLGFLSKWVPELHTTRTFEIPACGTALVTEPTEEIRNIFTENEVIFFEDRKELVKRIDSLLKNPQEIDQISRLGMRKVQVGRYTYFEIMSDLLKKIGIG